MFREVLIFKVKEGCMEEMQCVMKELVLFARGRESCLRIDALMDNDNYTVVLDQEWTSAEEMMAVVHDSAISEKDAEMKNMIAHGQRFVLSKFA